MQLYVMNALKAYNNVGLIGAVSTLVGLGKTPETTVRINSADSSLFHTVEKRLARTRLVRSANPTSQASEEFCENLIPFMAAISACHEYLANKTTTKTKHFSVHLTYFGAIDSSPTYILTILNVTTGNPVMTSTITGIY